MTYTEILIKVLSKDLDKATSIVEMLDIGGVYIEDYSDMLDCPLVQQVKLVEENLLKKDKKNALIHIYLHEDANILESMEFLHLRFDSENITMTMCQSTVKEEDYANSWKQYYKPIKIKNVVVVPEWEEYIPNEGEKILKIDPGMAFGTGTHETTSLCIEALQECVRKSDDVFDIGCGSGILSITSLILEAGSVDAVDIDPNAVKIAYENTSLNTYDGEFNAFSGNIINNENEIKNKINNKKYDVIVANIVADVIISLSAFAKNYLKESGRFITSGIITERADDVENALKGNGFIIIDKKVKNGWVCFISK